MPKVSHLKINLNYLIIVLLKIICNNKRMHHNRELLAVDHKLKIIIYIKIIINLKLNLL